MTALRVAGWSCPHATITVSTTYPPPAAVTMAWCGCEMQPVYAEQGQTTMTSWKGCTVTSRYPGAA